MSQRPTEPQMPLPQLVREYQDSLIRFAQQQLGNRFAGQIDASSIIQEVFTRLCEEQNNLEEPECTIGEGKKEEQKNLEGEKTEFIISRAEVRLRIRHKILDAIQRLNAGVHGLGRIVHLGENVPDNGRPVTAGAAEPGSSDPAARFDLGDLIATLPEELAAVVRAHHIDGLTLREIAEKLGIAPSTVCRRLQAAIEFLRGKTRSSIEDESATLP